jgi:HSP90 family molecular chaperone
MPCRGSLAKKEEPSIRKNLIGLLKRLLHDAEGCTNELIRSDMSQKIIEEQKRRMVEYLDKYVKWYTEFGDEMEQLLDHEDEQLKKRLEELLRYSNEILSGNLNIIGSLSRLINVLQPCKNRGKKLYEKLYF